MHDLGDSLTIRPTQNRIKGGSEKGSREGSDTNDILKQIGWAIKQKVAGTGEG